MILSRYSTFRRFFARPGAPIDPADGLPIFPGPLLPDGSFDNTGGSSLVRVNGFSSTITVFTAGGATYPGSVVGPLLDPTKFVTGDPVWPLDLTCNAFTEDAVFGVHEYDWYVCQRRDPERYPIVGSPLLSEFTATAFLCSLPDPGASGRIALTPNTSAVAVLLPGLTGAELLTPTAMTTLFKNVFVYVKRRSDGAIQYATFYQGIPS